MITALGLPDAVFAALASGAGGPGVIRHLQEAQHNKHLMLLRALAEAAGGTAPGSASFHAGYELLTRVQEADPGAEAWLLGLPHFGGWAHDCLIHIDQGTRADLAYFACAAAAAAVRAGVPFEVDVPVRGGRVALPGLGSWHVADEPGWIQLRSDGEYVSVGAHLKAPAKALVPDDGSAGLAEHWRGTPAVRAVADGLAWDVLFETADPYLDRYTRPMATGMPPDEVDRWRRRIRSAWAVLVRHHRPVAESIRDGLSVIVPLTPLRGTDLVSATTPAAFGAIAMSWQPDPVTMAETFVHEFQHVKLCGLMDMIPLVRPGGPKAYAPWRQDPRPVGGLLQGMYAHLGIARFWNVQRHAETNPDDVLRAQTAFARWRSTIDTTAHALLRSGCLTQPGERFVRVLQDQGKSLLAEHLPDVPLRIAEAVTLDHWLTWQVRHTATDAEAVAGLAAAYRRGEPFREPPPGAQPGSRIEEDIRKVGSDVRTRLLNLRYLEPARYRELLGCGIHGLSEADTLLFSGEPDKAVQAYRDQIAGSADPLPDAWIGLALAIHQLGRSPLQAAFATRLALILDVHTRLNDRADPLELAGWFG